MRPYSSRVAGPFRRNLLESGHVNAPRLQIVPEGSALGGIQTGVPLEEGQEPWPRGRLRISRPLYSLTVL